MSERPSYSRSISKYYSSSERGSVASSNLLRKSKKSQVVYDPSLGARNKSLQEHEFLQKPPPKYSIKTRYQILVAFSKIAMSMGKGARRWGKLVYQSLIAGLIFCYIVISVFCRRELTMPLVTTIILILISVAVITESLVMQNKSKIPFDKKKFKRIFRTRMWKIAKICIVVIFSIGALVNAGMMIPKNNILLVPFVVSIGMVVTAFLFSLRITRVNSRSTIIGLFGQYYLTALVFYYGVDSKFWEYIGMCFHYLAMKGYQGARILLDDYVDYYEMVAYFAVIHLFHLILLALIRTGIMRHFYYITGFVMRFYVGLTVAEGSTAICTIFINPIVSVVLMKMYIKRMNWSELHFMMCVGNSVVPPYLWPILISKYKIPAQHIIVSNFLSVMATAAFSKIVVPEKFKSRVGLKALRKLSNEGPKGPMANLIIAVLSMFPLACLALAVKLVVQVFNDVLISCIETFFQAYIVHIRLWEILGRPIAFVIERLGVQSGEALLFAEVLWLKFFYSDSVAFKKLDTYLNGNMAVRLSHYSQILAIYSVASIPSMVTNIISLLMLNYCAPNRMYRLAQLTKKAIVCTYASAIFKICILWIYIEPDLIQPIHSYNEVQK